MSSNTHRNHTPKTLSDTKRLSRFRKPSQLPSSTSAKTLSPEGPTIHSVEEYAKMWQEFCESFTE